MQNSIYNILNEMAEYLNISQMKHLQEILIKRLEEDYKSMQSINIIFSA